ncbi:hypothetical protein MC7420_7254 [Coleofasciculus chthonoplastes PCC 7420]|uniref:Uncharacterized protein n=1 Tax=Coleofasciculus chthonoplastes PCC 7420 TaxID=118168 RepID=B4VHX2_9CYAN|nr:hypothetical protein MC7420_7254 [Coleofasciculus chthonoplastes PCC 7420]
MNKTSINIAKPAINESFFLFNLTLTSNLVFHVYNSFQYLFKG